VFGHLQLREINRQLIRAWVAEVAPHYKPATVRSWKVNLTTILNVAVSLDYLPASFGSRTCASTAAVPTSPSAAPSSTPAASSAVPGGTSSPT